MVEYAGEVVRGLPMAGRMTICNMSIEAGARAGMIAPDDTTFAYLEGRPAAPKGAEWERALDRWRALPSDPDATYDRVVEIDVGDLAPQVSWGTNPGMVVPVDGVVPDPADFADPEERKAAERALVYMALDPGTAIQDIEVDRVFIGSCTNARIEDLREAAKVVAGKAGAPERPRARRARLGRRQAACRGGGARPDLRGRRVRMAAGGLLDVPRNEPGHPPAGRALRLDLQPQLRGATGPRRAHAPRQPGHGRGDRARRPLRRRPRARAGAGRVKAFRRTTGRVAVLDRADVDTDQIIPKQFLKRIERSGFGEFLFFDWVKEPGFELNRPEAKGASILLAGRNFGCGSSREHAAWAIQDYGFEVVIAPSFGDIFRTNSLKSGLLPVALPEEQVKELMAAGSGAELTVDLEEQTAGPFPFELDSFERRCLLEGLDDIALTLRHEDEIAAFEAAHPSPIATTAL